MTRRLFVSIALTLLYCGVVYSQPGQSLAASDVQAIRAAGKKIARAHVAKLPMQAGDWLEKTPEPGQTFDEYVASNPNRRTGRHTTIYIQPIGSFSKEQQVVIGRVKELLSLYFGFPVKELAGIGLQEIPPTALRNDQEIGHPQILTTYVFEQLLLPRRPADAVAVLGLTMTDLWPGPETRLRFAFGQGSLGDRIGIYSLARYGNAAGSKAERQLFLHRSLKVPLHEMGHMLGITHCTAFECGMNASNHVEELDRNHLGFCPECEQKVWWACRLDPVERYESLVKFAKKNKLPTDERLWRSSLNHLR